MLDTKPAQPFVRTVLGDIPSAQMGVTYAHEHLIIETSFPTLANPDFLLNDVVKVAEELTRVYQAGGKQWSIPCPPTVAATC